MRVALGIEYAGDAYCGWQSQSCGCGVQDKLQQALNQMAQKPISTIAAGRTDTGVHALTQVVHFDTDVARPDQAWVRGVNTMLPANIRVLWAKQVQADFHARFSAFQRSYQYLLVNAEVAPALLTHQAGWYHQPLALAPMQKAMQFLLGEHDFSGFRASECQAKSPVKIMNYVNVRQYSEKFIFDFSANAFLQHQVRNMVGALIYIGSGKYPPEFMQELIALKDRAKAPPTFSPAGLYLTGVGYDAKWGLPATQRILF